MLCDNPLFLGLGGALVPPDTRTISEWAADNVVLVGGKGAFYDPTANRSQGFAFDWLRDDAVRQLNLLWPTGFGKSVFFEVWVAHTVAEDPADMQLSHQTDRPAARWVEKRVLPTLERCRATAAIMRATHRHKKRKLEFQLANGVTIYCGGANMRNLQDVSLPRVGGQECWDWPTTGGNAFAEAKARTHDRYDEKIVFCGQGGDVNSHFEAECGTGALWETGFVCPKCKVATPYLPRTGDARQDFEAVMKWDETAAAAPEIPWAKLLRSVRYQAPCCGARFRDLPNTRRRLADRAVLIEHESAGAVPGVITHTAPILAAHWVSWGKLVTEYLVARRAEMGGDDRALAAFVKKRLARFWSPRPLTVSLRLDGARYSLNDYFPQDGQPAPRWEREAFRFLCVDPGGAGASKFWYTVRAWRVDGTSRLLAEGLASSMEILAELANRYEVRPECVGIDCGYEPEVIAAARWKYKREILVNGRPQGFACWIMLRGDRAETFPHHEGGRTIRRMYSPATAARTADGTPYQVTKFSNTLAKDYLAAAMADGDRWQIPSDHSEQYLVHMEAEGKIEVKPGEWRWEKIGKDGRPNPKTPNHLRDCEVQQVVMASLFGLLRDNLTEQP